MVGTPFIAHLKPSELDGNAYDRTKTHDKQEKNFPKTFIDAMEVREQVFVEEQGVPLHYESDSDDSRSNHFVIYASICKTVEKEVRDIITGELIRPRRSETRRTPIGTIRLVPFPHPPHPQAGGRYLDNKLQNEEVNKLTPDQERRITCNLPYGQDPPTSLHDGQEPYIKLGRLAVIKDFRGRKIAGQLWTTARDWLIQNPYYYNPSVKKYGLKALAADCGDSKIEIPVWRGLICIHAQKTAAPLWEKWGFEVDEKMGEWWEEGILHVGMFQRLKVNDVPIQIK